MRCVEGEVLRERMEGEGERWLMGWIVVMLILILTGGVFRGEGRGWDYLGIY